MNVTSNLQRTRKIRSAQRKRPCVKTIIDTDEAIRLRLTGINFREVARQMKYDPAQLRLALIAQGKNKGRAEYNHLAWDKMFGASKIMKFIQNGNRVGAAAAHFKIDPTALVRYMISRGYERKRLYDKGEYRHLTAASLNDTKNIMRLHKEGKSRAEISAELNLSSYVVYNRLKFHGIVVRRDDALRLRFPDQKTLTDELNKFSSFHMFCRSNNYASKEFFNWCLRNGLCVTTKRKRRSSCPDAEETKKLYSRGHSLLYISEKLGCTIKSVRTSVILSGLNITSGRKGRATGFKPTDKMARKAATSRSRNMFAFDFFKYKNLKLAKFINNQLGIVYGRTDITVEYAHLFMDKFYHDACLRALFCRWMSDKSLYQAIPSLDHRTPLSRGGTWDLDNLQFLTWFENRVKHSQTQEEWVLTQDKFKTISAMFVGQIMKSHKFCECQQQD